MFVGFSFVFALFWWFVNFVPFVRKIVSLVSFLLVLAFLSVLSLLLFQMMVVAWVMRRVTILGFHGVMLSWNTFDLNHIIFHYDLSFTMSIHHLFVVSLILQRMLLSPFQWMFRNILMNVFLFLHFMLLVILFAVVFASFQNLLKEIKLFLSFLNSICNLISQKFVLFFQNFNCIFHFLIKIPN